MGQGREEDEGNDSIHAVLCNLIRIGDIGRRAMLGRESKELSPECFRSFTESTMPEVLLPRHRRFHPDRVEQQL